MKEKCFLHCVSHSDRFVIVCRPGVVEIKTFFGSEPFRLQTDWKLSVHVLLVIDCTLVSYDKCRLYAGLFSSVHFIRKPK